ncbi:uroporphyrinogen-III C-methyltransferase [Comamonadaceae bacterium OTU4NAUVB1]|jgi:uroporphyrin-III C-methyltransferase|nr:uroporphyrinogen-III C-methyltransferase [Comamonadaceae bacterium OTU4NAUVB1]
MSPASPLPDRTVADVAARTTLPSPPTAGGAALARLVLVAVSLLALVALVIGLMLWQKVSGMQEQLARQSADALAQSLEARTLARQAQDTVRDTAARLSLAEGRVAEVALQRAQLEELLQSLSRSRDENLMVDVESTLRLALQQAQVTGNTGALLAALRTVDQRIARAAQPRLAPLQRALQRDADRLRASASGDGSEAMARLDELLRGIDDLPTVNALPARSGGATDAWQIEPIPDDAPMWQRILASVRNEARSLVRVGRIDRPESVLLSPDQAFFLRENLKLKLLGVRLSLMSRQVEPARSELAAVTASLNRYFDPSSRRVQVAATQLQQLQLQVRAVEPPRLDDTFAALSTAMAGR